MADNLRGLTRLLHLSGISCCASDPGLADVTDPSDASGSTQPTTSDDDSPAGADRMVSLRKAVLEVRNASVLGPDSGSVLGFLCLSVVSKPRRIQMTFFRYVRIVK